MSPAKERISSAESHGQGKDGANCRTYWAPQLSLPLAAPCWCLHFLQVDFLRDYRFHIFKVLWPWEKLASVPSSIRGFDFPGLHQGLILLVWDHVLLPFHQKEKSEQLKTVQGHFNFLCHSSWYKVTSPWKCSPQTLLFCGPQSLGW